MDLLLSELIQIGFNLLIGNSSLGICMFYSHIFVHRILLYFNRKIL